jgi:2-amino-4-hydroxy-6-hydroxymethyldihydropteridine diphosphokinase
VNAVRQQRLRVELPAVLSLGSNLGDREATLREAIADIARIDGVTVLAASGLVESAAVKPDGVDESAPAYLNAVVTVRSALDPDALLSALNAIEQRHGRVRVTAVASPGRGARRTCRRPAGRRRGRAR